MKEVKHQPLKSIDLKAINILSQSINPNCKNCIFNISDVSVNCEKRNMKFDFVSTIKNMNKIYKCFEHKLCTEKIVFNKTKKYTDKEIFSFGKKIEEKTNKKLIHTIEKEDSLLFFLSDFNNL